MIDGIPVNVIDTAGIRKAGNLIEQEGIRRALSAAENADVVILIADVNKDDIQDLKTIAAEFTPKKNVLYVFNKIDLTGHEPGKSQLSGGVRELYIFCKNRSRDRRAETGDKTLCHDVGLLGEYLYRAHPPHQCSA